MKQVKNVIPAQVTSDFLDRLRQMKARMNGLKTQVETVGRFPSALRRANPYCQACISSTACYWS